MEYRSANLDYPLTWPEAAPAAYPWAAAGESRPEPTRLVSLMVFVLVASSSVVMVEPALCDILFPPVLVLTLVTGHLLSPLRLPALFTGSILVFMLANYGSLMGARNWGSQGAVFYMAVTFYLLVLSAFFALFLGKFGPVGMRLVRDGYQLGAVVSGGIGVLASLHILPNSQIYFRDPSMLRVQSTFEDPNVFAPFLIGALFLSLPPLLHGGRIQARHLLVIALSLAGIALAFSRGAWVHLAVSLAVFVALELFVIRDQRANRRLVAGMLTVAPVLVVGIAFLLVTSDLGDYLTQRLSLQSYDQTRFSNQVSSLTVAHENIWGVGPGEYTRPRFIQDVHNNYLKILVENGIIGLFSFLAMVATSLFYGLAGVLRKGRLAPVQAGCVAVLVGIMVESIVIDTLHWRHFFLFIGIPIGLTMFERLREPDLESAPPVLHPPSRVPNY